MLNLLCKLDFLESQHTQMWVCVMPQEQGLALREEEPEERAWGRGEVGRCSPRPI